MPSCGVMDYVKVLLGSLLAGIVIGWGGTKLLGTETGKKFTARLRRKSEKKEGE